MKRLIFYLILIFGLAQFSYLVAQEVQVEEFCLGSITDIPTIITSVPGEVVACGVYICDNSWSPYWLIDYAPGQTWYMAIAVVNWSNYTVSFKLEYDLRYGDGAGYKTYRTSNLLAGASFNMYRINVTSYVAKLGILTLTGRVYGTGMGNDNKVTSQVIAY